MEGLTNLGASLVRELGLWVGVILSVLTGLLWLIPPVVVYGLGSGHTGDTMESAMLVCGFLVLVSFAAAVLFLIGAIKNTVSGESGAADITYDGGDTERV